MSAETIAFQAAVQRYIASQDELTSIRKRVKELNDLSRQDTDVILAYMERANVNKCTAGHYTLMVDTKKKLPQMNAAFVLEKAKDVLQLTPDQAEVVIQRIKEARQEESVEERCLRRRKARNAAASSSTAAAPSNPSLSGQNQGSISNMVDELYD